MNTIYNNILSSIVTLVRAQKYCSILLATILGEQNKTRGLKILFIQTEKIVINKKSVLLGFRRQAL